MCRYLASPQILKSVFFPNPGVDSDDYSTLVRVLPSFSDMSLFIFDVFKELGYIQGETCYYNISLVWENDETDDPEAYYYYHMVDSINEHFSKRGVSINYVTSRNDSYEDVIASLGPGNKIKYIAMTPRSTYN